ncbi:histidine phosphotransferase family protein [Pararhodobacter oceanensis]|uniref:Histidine phosphotransferase n=1 Tax=Pararhodobacter oceanensis TaxID=2172121 RepID=A0A2T8HTJ9_9RHOB|nr:histidine phosphotransferase family protein [Pararhodobacter oceanensis]PVH28769.1 histidine phosphotransferase [Pararhodobacter oceanensis]
MSDSDLSALIGSRLCHDLVSPLGAIGNGVELLQMMQPPSAELDLVSDAVKMAQARVRLFRLAFGSASADQMVTAAELVNGLSALDSGGRIALTCDVSASVSRPAARRLALAAMCAETALAWGGKITVSDDTVTAGAERLKLDTELWQPMVEGAQIAAPSSANVHFALLAASGPLRVVTSETEVQIGI